MLMNVKWLLDIRLEWVFLSFLFFKKHFLEKEVYNKCVKLFLGLFLELSRIFAYRMTFGWKLGLDMGRLWIQS